MTEGLETVDGVADAGPRPQRHALLHYVLSAVALGVRHALGADAVELQRPELVKRLRAAFGGAEELKGAVEEAFERGLQSIVVGLKAPWLLMETGETNFCESFTTKVAEQFKQEAGLEGRLFLDFLDGFFLDYDTALDALPRLLGLSELDEAAFLSTLLDAAEAAVASGDAASFAASATACMRDGFVRDVGLEEEHPIVRLGSWRDLMADAVLVAFLDSASTHPAWFRYADQLEEDRIARLETRAAASNDDTERARLALARGLNERIRAFRDAFGLILPNRDWLFDLADRLEDTDENASSDLLQGRLVGSRDLPKLVNAALGKVHSAQKTSRVVRAADALEEPRPAVVDALRKARRDFRRSHWTGEGYGEAALDLGAAMFPVYGPRVCERYFREALAFGADVAAAHFSLFACALQNNDRARALEHLREAAKLDPERFEPFDFGRYTMQSILGAGPIGITFLATTAEGEDCVVKTLWDEVQVVDSRPALKSLQALAKAKVAGAAKLIHLGLHKKARVYVVTQFIEGDDLEAFREAQGGEAPAHTVAEIGWRAADILARAHAAGVVHRNVRPGNVRVGAGEEGLEVTLLDFAEPSYVLSPASRVRGVRRIAAWSRLGRAVAEDLASYTAPEMLKTGIDGATTVSDVYGLGATLYRLATGLSARRVDPRAIPESLRDALVKALDRRPENRWQTADELRDALKVAAEKSAAAPKQPSLTESQESEFGLANLDAAEKTTALQPGAAEAFARSSLPPADPFADPFAPAAAPGGDPFGGDPFAAPGLADPFALPPGADPFAAPAAADPFAAPAAADPFGAPAADPFAAPAADPFGAPSGDPFAPAAGGFGAPAADPFGAPAADPFAAPAADPFGAPAADPFGAPAADPFAPAADPFAPADPFAAPAGAMPFTPAPPNAAQDFATTMADPFASPPGAPNELAQTMEERAGLDPFAAAPKEEEPEALDPNEALALLDTLMSTRPKKPAPAKKGPPPAKKGAPAKGAPAKGAPAKGAPAKKGPPAAKPGAPQPIFPGAAAPGDVPDPFAPVGADPFAAPAADPFAAPAADPFAQQPPPSKPLMMPMLSGEIDAADVQALSVPGEELPVFGATEEAAPAESLPEPAQDVRASMAHEPSTSGRQKAIGRRIRGEENKQVAEDGYGLVISGLALKSKKEAAIAILVEVRGMSRDEAYELCRSPVVPVLKRVTKEEAESLAEKFRAAKINVRVTERKERH